MNKRRASEEGIEAGVGASGVIGGNGDGDGKVVEVAAGSEGVTEAVNQAHLRPEDYEDMTDWKTVGFRYRL
ncbi:allantoate permease [Apiospora arundinis]